MVLLLEEASCSALHCPR